RPDLTKVFLGIHPRLMQVPPSGPESTSATRAPSFNPCLSALMPAAPPPMTSRSYWFMPYLLATPRKDTPSRSGDSPAETGPNHTGRAVFNHDRADCMGLQTTAVSCCE